ncbi:hypothetical protein D9M71_634670 [compost metagenome]
MSWPLRSSSTPRERTSPAVLATVSPLMVWVTSTLDLSMSNSARVPVMRPGISSLAPISQLLPSSGSRPLMEAPPVSGAMVELGLKDSL